MLVSWTDDAGVTHTGDDQGKAYKRHLASRKDKPTEAEGGPVVKTLVTESGDQVSETTEVVITPDVESATTDRPKRTR